MNINSMIKFWNEKIEIFRKKKEDLLVKMK